LSPQPHRNGEPSNTRKRIGERCWCVDVPTLPADSTHPCHRSPTRQPAVASMSDAVAGHGDIAVATRPLVHVPMSASIPLEQELWPHRTAGVLLGGGLERGGSSQGFAPEAWRSCPAKAGEDRAEEARGESGAPSRALPGRGCGRRGAEREKWHRRMQIRRPSSIHILRAANERSLFRKSVFSCSNYVIRYFWLLVTLNYFLIITPH
jgi:hypothetical protein